jgi:hypothetical protein
MGLFLAAMLGLELLADHLVHIADETHHLPKEDIGTVYGPSNVGADVRGVAFGIHRDLSDVVAFERLDEIHLENDFGRRRIRDLHAPLADVPVAVPLVHGTLAACRAAIGSLHRGVLFLPGRPGAMAVQVVDEREDLLRRRLDAGRALDTKGVGLGRGIGERNGEQDDDDDDDDCNYFEHCSLLCGSDITVMSAAVTSITSSATARSASSDGRTGR